MLTFTVKQLTHRTHPVFEQGLSLHPGHLLGLFRGEHSHIHRHDNGRTGSQLRGAAGHEGIPLRIVIKIDYHPQTWVGDALMERVYSSVSTACPASHRLHHGLGKRHAGPLYGARGRQHLIGPQVVGRSMDAPGTCRMVDVGHTAVAVVTQGGFFGLLRHFCGRSGSQ